MDLDLGDLGNGGVVIKAKSDNFFDDIADLQDLPDTDIKISSDVMNSNIIKIDNDVDNAITNDIKIEGNSRMRNFDKSDSLSSTSTIDMSSTSRNIYEKRSKESRGPERQRPQQYDANTTTSNTNNNDDNDDDGLKWDFLLNKDKKVNETIDISNLKADYSDSDDGDSGRYESTRKDSYNDNRDNKSDVFSNNDNEEENTGYVEQVPKFHNENEEKTYYLIKLTHLKKMGVELTREYTINSRLSDIKLEYRYQKEMYDQEAGVAGYRDFMVSVVSFVEMVNRAYNPLGAQLDGWSNNVRLESESPDSNIYSALVEIYHKYKKYEGILAPEIKLIGALCFSGFIFHCQAAFMKNIEQGFNGQAGSTGQGGQNPLASIAKGLMGMFGNGAGYVPFTGPSSSPFGSNDASSSPFGSNSSSFNNGANSSPFPNQQTPTFNTPVSPSSGGNGVDLNQILQSFGVSPLNEGPHPVVADFGASSSLNTSMYSNPIPTRKNREPSENPLPNETKTVSIGKTRNRRGGVQNVINI